MEHVKATSPGLRWEPNGVVESDLRVREGWARLELGPHPDDQNRRSVILTFGDVRHARIGFPNDEGRIHHPLWHQGLIDVRWIGTVEESALVDAIHESCAVPARLTHWVVLLKEETVEVVARSLEVTRE